MAILHWLRRSQLQHWQFTFSLQAHCALWIFAKFGMVPDGQARELTSDDPFDSTDAGGVFKLCPICQLVTSRTFKRQKSLGGSDRDLDIYTSENPPNAAQNCGCLGRGRL